MMRLLRAGSILFALSLLLAACSSGQGPVVNIPVSVEDGPAAASAVSAYRAGFGLGSVVVDSALSRAAQLQAREMAERRTLSDEVASSLRRRLIAVGVRDVPVAVNVGRAHPTLARMLEGWRATPWYAENLRLAGATRLGVARADGPGGPWWALIIAGDPQPGFVWR